MKCKVFFNEDGVEMSNLSHMRLIGDRTYTAKHKIVDGVVKDETIETTLDENEVAAFKKDWEEFGVQEPIPKIDLLNLFLVAMIISVGVKIAFPEVNLLAIIVSTANLEWPMLWRITMNSLHNEGIYELVN